MSENQKQKQEEYLLKPCRMCLVKPVVKNSSYIQNDKISAIEIEVFCPSCGCTISTTRKTETAFQLSVDVRKVQAQAFKATEVKWNMLMGD